MLRPFVPRRVSSEQNDRKRETQARYYKQWQTKKRRGWDTAHSIKQRAEITLGAIQHMGGGVEGGGRGKPTAAPCKPAPSQMRATRASRKMRLPTHPGRVAASRLAGFLSPPPVRRSVVVAVAAPGGRTSSAGGSRRRWWQCSCVVGPVICEDDPPSRNRTLRTPRCSPPSAPKQHTIVSTCRTSQCAGKPLLRINKHTNAPGDGFFGRTHLQQCTTGGGAAPMKVAVGFKTTQF